MNKLVAPLCGVLVVGLSACGGSKSDTASSQAKPATVTSGSTKPSANSGTTSSSAPVSSSAAPTNLMYLSSSAANLRWSGGMVANATETSVTGWLPGMGDVQNCPISLTQPNETFITDPVVAATKSDDPKVVLTYAVKQAANGLNAEETHDYAQIVNLKSCSLGQRVDLLGKGIPDSSSAGSLKPLAAKGDILVYQTLGDGAKGADGALVGFNAKSGKVEWTLKDASTSVGVQNVAGDGTLNTFVPINEQDASYNTKINLINAEDGKVLAGDVSFRDPGGNLDDDHVLYTSNVSLDNAQFIESGGNKTPVKGGVFSSNNFTFMDDGSGHRVLVGFYRPSADSNDSALGYVGTDGTIKQILSAEKVSSLNLQLLGGGNGRLYVKTTSQNLVLGLDGKQIGQPYDTATYPYTPAGEQHLKDGLYTFWQTQGGAGVITKDGHDLPQVH